MTHTLFHKKEDIEAWLNQYDIENYTLVADKEYGYVVDVAGSVLLSSQNLKNFRVKFNKVMGNFECFENELISLFGAPHYVKHSFECSHNNLDSLKYSPTYVGYNFYCSNNQLISLEFCPEAIYGWFNCSSNNLSSLRFGPQSVGGSFDCRFNSLTTLEFCPKKVSLNFYCNNNKINSLEFCPEVLGVEKEFCCFDNPELGAIQQIKNFSEILKIHKETLIQIEQKKLEQSISLINEATIVSPPSFKI